MTPSYNVDIFMNPADTQQGEYLVELRCEGKSIAQARTRIDRQALLLHEHAFNAHDYGLELYRSIFTGTVDREYQRLVGRAGAAASVRMHLVISEYAAELHALPWERIFHTFGDEEVPLAISAQTPFSRFLISGAGDQKPISTHSLRLLVAVANPTDLSGGLAPVKVVDEVTSLADLLVRLQGRVVGTLLAGCTGLPAALQQRLVREGWTVVEGATSWGNIQRHLYDQHILHLVTHGQLKGDTAYLLLEHEGSDKVARGALERVSDQSIMDSLAGVHPLPQLVFLAACESAKRPAKGANPFVGLAPKLVLAGVPAVVAMQDLVPMELAHTLSIDFYRRLFEHGQVDRVLNEARALLYKADRFEWAIPVLFLRMEHGQLFDLKPVAPARPFEPEMVFVPGGPFLMGSAAADGIPVYETPQHPVSLPAYFIGRYPITNREYAEFIKQVKTQDPPVGLGWFNREPPADRLNQPASGISWYDAAAYCRWLSKVTGRHYRLPTEAEWEKAARGTDGRRYPWGDTWENQLANVGGENLMDVTRYAGGASPFGCEDLLGNVQEWTATLWSRGSQQPEFVYPYDAQDGREIIDSNDLPPQPRLVHRGGSFRSQAGAVRCALRGNADPASRIAHRGFRVVREVD